MLETLDGPTIGTGDIWVLGNHRLICGDSTSIDNFETFCENQLVDLWLIDPPYHVAYVGKTKDVLIIQNDEMIDGDFRLVLSGAYSGADAVMTASEVFYIWHADGEDYNARGVTHDIKRTVTLCLLWRKQSMLMGCQDYYWQHEPCLYGCNDSAANIWEAEGKLRHGGNPSQTIKRRWSSNSD